MPPPTSFLVIRATSTASSNSSSNTGLIVGIVVGAIILVLLIVGVVVSEVLRRRRKNKRPIPGTIVDFFKAKSVADSPNSDASFGTGASPLLYTHPNPSSSKMEEFNPYSNVSIPHPPPSPDVENERGALLSHSRKRSVSDSTLNGLPPVQHAPERTHTPSSPQHSHSPWSSASAFMQESSTPISPTPSTTSSKTVLPRLTIPGGSKANSSDTITATNYAARHPVATVETITSASVPEPDDVSESSCSAYSQGSASTRQRKIWEDDAVRPPVPPIPEQYQQQYRPSFSSSDTETLEGIEESEGAGVGRSTTRVVAQLLKARARRGAGKPLTRSSTTVSRIERAGSIRSVVDVDDYPSTNSPMDTLTELPSAVSTTFPNPFQSALSSRNPSASTSSVAPPPTLSLDEVEMSPQTPAYSQVQEHLSDVKSLRPDKVVTDPIGSVRPLAIRKSNDSIERSSDLKINTRF